MAAGSHEDPNQAVHDVLTTLASALREVLSDEMKPHGRDVSFLLIVSDTGDRGFTHYVSDMGPRTAIEVAQEFVEKVKFH